MGALIIWTVATAVNWFLIATIIDGILMGIPFIKVYSKVKAPSYIIDHHNQFDIQQAMECSGYSSAYLLRHLVINVKGKKIYEEMPCKMRGGAVYPKGIRIALKNHGVRVRYRMGSINTLKWELQKGNSRNCGIQAVGRCRYISIHIFSKNE